MATGDAPDMLARLKAVLPNGWFPDQTPILDGVLSGLAATWSWAYALLAYVRQQSRLLTMAGVWLDVVAADFFAGFIARRTNESDVGFLGRIRRELFREKGTRAGLIAALTDLTGRVPIVFEPAYPLDTGGYGTLGMTAGTGLEYGAPFVRQGPATYIDGTGTMQTAPANVERFQSGVPLIEGVGANYLPLGYAPGAASVTVANSTDIAPLLAGEPVKKHTRTLNTGGDTNCAALSMAGFPTTGVAIRGSFYLWIPSALAAKTSISISTEGSVTGSVAMNADLTKRDQWQQITSHAALTAGFSSSNIVLRINSPVIGDVVYTTAWMAELDSGAATSFIPPLAVPPATRAPDILPRGGDGGYGSLLLPFQFFVTAYRPSGTGVANVGGWYSHSGWAGGGYGVGAIEWASRAMIAGQVLDADIYAEVNDVRPVGTVAWTAISS